MIQMQMQNIPLQMAKTNIHRAYNQLREKIITCELLPGDKLKIESLKVMLDMGTTPIRESLSLLTSDGLVNRMDQRGFCVAPISRANFQEILMLRCSLEDMALRKSMKNGDIAWEEHLVILHHRLSRANVSDIDVWEHHHKNFHMALIAQSECPILLNFCNKLYDQNIRYRFLAKNVSNYKDRNVLVEHTDILTTVLNGNADTASNILIQHYKNTGKFLNKILDKSTVTGWT